MAAVIQSSLLDEDKEEYVLREVFLCMADLGGVVE